MSTTMLAIGTRKGLWLARSTDERATWQVGPPQHLMQEIPSVAFDVRRDPLRVLVGARSEHWGSNVIWSDDLGGSWEETPNGAMRFPADTTSSVERVWQLTPDTADRPGVVWAGCEPTSLWRSDDGGEHFALVRGLWDHPHRSAWAPGFGGAAVHSVFPDPASDRVIVAMSTGGVYVSADRAESWRPSNQGISAYFLPDPAPEFGQCVHKIAVDADGRTLYAQNHHGVYRSSDGAASWTSIAAGLPADFGFPIVAHPTLPGAAWVVPLISDGARVPPEGRLRVWRTLDAGDSWEESVSGLPDSCWTVVLRDAFCVDDGDPAGVYVGTRDGGIYGSRDGGEHFDTIAEHLPDVLVVRAITVP